MFCFQQGMSKKNKKVPAADCDSQTWVGVTNPYEMVLTLINIRYQQIFVLNRALYWYCSQYLYQIGPYVGRSLVCILKRCVRRVVIFAGKPIFQDVQYHMKLTMPLCRILCFATTSSVMHRCPTIFTCICQQLLVDQKLLIDNYLYLA